MSREDVCHFIERLAADNGHSLQWLSKRMKCNHAYLHQFVAQGTPVELPERIREALAPLLRIHPDELRNEKVQGMKEKSHAWKNNHYMKMLNFLKQEIERWQKRYSNDSEKTFEYFWAIIPALIQCLARTYVKLWIHCPRDDRAGAYVHLMMELSEAIQQTEVEAEEIYRSEGIELPGGPIKGLMEAEVKWTITLIKPPDTVH